MPVPRLTAEVLLAHALRRDRAYLFAHSGEALTEPVWDHYRHSLHERRDGKPTQYITGVQEFYGREFRVTPAVLIPRPETEHLCETALQLGLAGKTVADIGTGSGAIAITLQLESGAAVLGTDISEDALLVARDNARRLGSFVQFRHGDLSLVLEDQSVDVLVSNPPYVADREREALQREVRDFEPPVALFGGVTGTEMYARLVADAPRVLRPGGHLLLELGFTLWEPVRALLDERWTEVRFVPDLAGIPRVLAARLK